MVDSGGLRGAVLRVPGVRPVARAGLGWYQRHIAALHPIDYLAPDDAPAPPGRFAELLFAHEGLQSTKWFHYCEIYDRIFGPYLDGFVEPDGTRRPLRFLEIGVRFGGSMRVWEEYFAPDTVIFGVDVDPRCQVAEDDRVQVRIGSQDDTGFLRAVVEDMGGIDVVLDDGSHINRHQLISFDTLFPLLSEGGLYVVEDTVTSYWAHTGGGYRRPGTMVETAKGMVDGLNKSWFHAPVGRRARLAHEAIDSIQFFEGMIAFEKRRRQPPAMKLAGKTRF